MNRSAELIGEQVQVEVTSLVQRSSGRLLVASVGAPVREEVW